MKRKVSEEIENTPMVWERLTKMPIHSKGGELGLKAITGLCALIEELEDCDTRKEVQYIYGTICGYCACCLRCGFIDKKDADKLMKRVRVIAREEKDKCKLQLRFEKKTRKERKNEK